VTVPESEPVEQLEPEPIREPAAHTEIQWLLLKLGADMGFNLWVARNDRNRSYDGHRFSELPALRSSLPLQFDDATNRTIELIDVLWLQKNSSLPRSRLRARHPSIPGCFAWATSSLCSRTLTFPSFCAPEDRREKVFAEVNRPTFSRLDPRLAVICRFISFEELRQRLAQVTGFVQYLKPDFLEDLSEACDLEQE
jgi:hypothetical protein